MQNEGALDNNQRESLEREGCQGQAGEKWATKSLRGERESHSVLENFRTFQGVPSIDTARCMALSDWRGGCGDWSVHTKKSCF